MFSKSCKYAIRATLYLAVHSDESNKINATQMAVELDIPSHLLAKVLQQLSKSQLITSSKGPGGGFYLTPQNRNITIEKIVHSIDGPQVFDFCILGLAACSTENPCPLHIQVFGYRAGLKYQLENLTVNEMAERIKMKNIRV